MRINTIATYIFTFSRLLEANHIANNKPIFRLFAVNFTRNSDFNIRSNCRKKDIISYISRTHMRRSTDIENVIPAEIK